MKTSAKKTKKVKVEEIIVQPIVPQPSSSSSESEDSDTDTSSGTSSDDAVPAKAVDAKSPAISELTALERSLRGGIIPVKHSKSELSSNSNSKAPAAKKVRIENTKKNEKISNAVPVEDKKLKKKSSKPSQISTTIVSPPQPSHILIKPASVKESTESSELSSSTSTSDSADEENGSQETIRVKPFQTEHAPETKSESTTKKSKEERCKLCGKFASSSKVHVCAKKEEEANLHGHEGVLDSTIMHLRPLAIPNSANEGNIGMISSPVAVYAAQLRTLIDQGKKIYGLDTFAQVFLPDNILCGQLHSSDYMGRMAMNELGSEFSNSITLQNSNNYGFNMPSYLPVQGSFGSEKKRMARKRGVGSDGGIDAALDFMDCTGPGQVSDDKHALIFMEKELDKDFCKWRRCEYCQKSKFPAYQGNTPFGCKGCDFFYHPQCFREYHIGQGIRTDSIPTHGLKIEKV